MPKLIAFYGSPGSGKTSIALKTAMETYIQTKDEIIAFLSPDMTVPSVALLFPNYAPDEVVSLSEIFDNTAITNESLLKNGVTVKNMKDFFALGFKAGENRFSFPTPTPEKINSLFSALSDVAGYIFVDCTNDENDEISKKALAIADAVVRIITPDLKGMAWYSSNKNSDRTEGEDLFNVVSVTEKDLYLPTEEVCTKLHIWEGLVVGNIPLLYVLNKDWFHTLIYELPGKITLGVCSLVIFVTYLFMLKFTKPIEYKG